MQGTKRQMDIDDAATAPSAPAKATADAPPGCVAIMSGVPSLPYDVCHVDRALNFPPNEKHIARGSMLPGAVFDADGNGPDVLVYSYDFEGTGADHTVHYPNQIGAVAFACLPRPDGAGRAFYAVSCFNSAMAAPSPAHGFDPERLAQFWSQPQHAAHLRKLEREAQPPREVTRAFMAWLDSFRAKRYFALTDLAQYDAAWLDHLHAQYTDKKGPMFLRYKEMHFANCTDSTMRGLLGDALAQWVSTKEVCEKVGVEYFAPEQEHDAVYDAYAIGVNFLRVAAAKGWLDRYLQTPVTVAQAAAAYPPPVSEAQMVADAERLTSDALMASLIADIVGAPDVNATVAASLSSLKP